MRRTAVQPTPAALAQGPSLAISTEDPTSIAEMRRCLRPCLMAPLSSLVNLGLIAGQEDGEAQKEDA